MTKTKSILLTTALITASLGALPLTASAESTDSDQLRMEKGCGHGKKGGGDKGHKHGKGGDCDKDGHKHDKDGEKHHKGEDGNGHDGE